MNTEQWQMLLDVFGDTASHAYQAAAQQAWKCSWVFQSLLLVFIFFLAHL